MIIDWFTVVAQGLNFLVLVWLLKRYLYKPILAAIDARENKIARAIADAASQRAAAEQERAACAAKVAALDVEGAALLKQAAHAAQGERMRLLADARAEVAALRAKQMTALNDEKRKLRQGIAHLAQQEVLAIARRVLVDLAGVSLEERVTGVFAQRLRILDANAKNALLAALGSEPAAVVLSAFALAEAQRAQIQNAVNQEFTASVRIRFEVSAEMLCGIELLAGGQKLAWSIAEYLAGLEQRIAPFSDSELSLSQTTLAVTAAAMATP